MSNHESLVGTADELRTPNAPERAVREVAPVMFFGSNSSAVHNVDKDLTLQVEDAESVKDEQLELPFGEQPVTHAKPPTGEEILHETKEPESVEVNTIPEAPVEGATPKAPVKD